MTEPDDPFRRIVDDRSADEALADWAADQLLSGRSIEEVETELTAAGWPATDATAVVESARQATRAARGVVTRDDVAGYVERQYRKSTRNWLSLVGRLVGIFGLLSSLRVRKRLGEVAQKPPEDSPPT